MTDLRFIKLLPSGMKEEVLHAFLGESDYFGVFRYVDNFTVSGISNSFTAEVSGASVTFQTEGDNLKPGVIVTTYNQCNLRGHLTGEPVVDSYGRAVYARLTSSTVLLPGTIDFVNSSTDAATTWDLRSLVSPGDLITNSSGYFAEVLSVDAVHLVFTQPWSGITATDSAQILSYLLSYYVFISAVETPYTFSVPLSVDVLFAESVPAVEIPFETFLFAAFGSSGVSSEIPIHIYEVLVISTGGQTAFTLSHIPKNISASVIMVNGIAYIYGVDYTISGVNLTWLNHSFALETTDILTAFYNY